MCEETAHPERGLQFGYLQQQREQHAAAEQPRLSVDTKKKELIGNVKNAGRTWGRRAERVNRHDFPSQGQGRAVPYGL